MKFTKFASSSFSTVVLAFALMFVLAPAWSYATAYNLAVSADVSADEEAGPLTFTVTIDQAAVVGDTVNLDWRVISGTADENNDVSVKLGSISFVNGTGLSQGVSVTLNDEAIVEGDETFTFEIFNATVTPDAGNSVAITTATRTGTIVNTDIATFSLAADVSVAENAGPAVYTVSTTDIIEASAADITISYASSVGAGDTAEVTDFSGSGNVTFTGTSQSETFSITIDNDAVVEQDETYTASLTGVVAGFAAIGGATRQGTIVNDDIPTLSINNSSLAEGDTGNTATGLLVTTDLAIASDTTVSFDWTVNHIDTTAADFNEATSGSLSFNNVAAGATVALPLTLKTDTVVERDEAYATTLSNGDIGGSTTSPILGSGTGLISNDDSPQLSIQASSTNTEGDSGQTTVNYVVTSDLVIADDAQVTFDYAINTGTTAADDLNIGSYSLALTNGTTVDVPVLLTGDTIVEGDETYTVGISNSQVTGSAVGATIGAANSGAGIITNDDIPTLTVSDSTIYEGDGATGFTVTTDLAVATDTTVSVDWLVNNGATVDADFSPNPPVSGAPLTFSGVASGSSVTVPLSAVDDAVEEPDEGYTLALTNGVITGTTGAPVTSDTGAGMILNDDHTFTITKTVEPTRGTLTGGGYSADFTFVVARGTDITFAMNATDSCYHIEDYQIDGTSKGNLASYNNQSPDYNTYTSDSYTFTSVDAAHSVNLDFAINTYTVATAAYGGNGSITATSELDCNTAGPTITATADTGYYITWFKVDGVVQAGAANQVSWSYTIPTTVTKDYSIEVAFAVKATLLHDPSGPFGAVAVYEYDAGTGTSTLLGLDVTNSVIVDYGTELRFLTVGETHTVQGPDYIVTPQQLDDRVHDHHLSKVTDNAVASSALCVAPDFTDTNYRTGPDCQYTIASMTENHDVDILFTGFVDVSAHGFGDVDSAPDASLIGTSGGTAIGSYEFDAGEERVLTFVPATGWIVNTLNYKLTPELIADDPGLTGITTSLTYTVPVDIDSDHGIQVNFAVETFDITASSTFEEILFHDAALTDLVRVADGDTVSSVEYDKNKEYFVLLNDPDFAAVGVTIDGTFIPIDTIRSYANGTLVNPNSSVFTFSIDPATPPATGSGINEILTITFVNVKVSHYLEVRDYDNVIIADVPLDAQANPNPPALMFVTDDSGSMDWEYLVQGASNGLYAGYAYLWSYNVVPYSVRAYSYPALQDAGRQDEWGSQWSGLNGMYFNPVATYAPWPDYTGTIDDDNDPITPEISFQLPATNDFADNLAHANIYRPRHHPWYNVSCNAALTMAKNRLAGIVPTAIEIEYMRTTCDSSPGNTDWEQTFDMDKEFQFIGGGGVELQEESAAVKTGTWYNFSSGDANKGTFQYDWDGTGTAVYTFIPTATTAHEISVSWFAYPSWSTSVPYRIQSATTTPIDVTVNVDQQTNGSYQNGMVSLGSFAFETGVPVTITVGPSVGGGHSIDALRITWVPTIPTKIASIIDAHYYTYDDVNGNEVRDVGEDIWLVNLTDPITYSKVLDSTKTIDASNLDNYLLGGDAALPSTLVTYAKPSDTSAFVLERQNFADWYSYYRTRQLAATSAESLAIEKMSNVEVGIRTINYSSSYGISQSALPVKVWGRRDKTPYLYYLLYSFKQGSYGTPLRSGLHQVARYFDATDGLSGDVKDTMGQSGLVKSDYTCGTGNSDSDDYLSPFAKDPSDNCAEKNGDRCKKTIAVLVTDGYWNGSYSDGIPALTLEPGHPTELLEFWDDSLAKTAYYYRFKNDMMDDSEGDEQFMITYGVSFGLNGTNVYNEDAKCSILDGSECPTWPAPSANNATTIDDLWHASVVGDGKYLNADSPDSLVKALSGIVSDIEGKKGSSAALAVNGDEMYETAGDGTLRMYQASWNTTGWTGDLKSYDIDKCRDPITGALDFSLTGCLVWSAQTTLGAPPTLGSTITPRIIATYNPWVSSGATGVPFNYSQLDPIQQERLFPYYANSIANPKENIVNFLRGDVLLNTAVSDKLRSRPALLGDIVNSQGRYQRYAINDSSGNAPGDAGYTPTYTGVIFVGANDGMLHAFSSEDGNQGKELFAYVPSLVYRNLRELANPDYTDTKHKMFVDSTPYTKEITDASGKKMTVLVGGLGKGGKGYYALDISNANTAITTEADLASRVLWEYPPAPDNVVANREVTFTANRIVFDTPLTSAEMATLLKYRFFEVIGANNDGGSVDSTNDGIYAIDDADGDGVLDGVAADGSYIQIPTAEFNVMSDINIYINGSISDPDMGYSFSKPTIVKSNDDSVGYNGWVVFFGNGYGSENGDSVLYILNPVTGALIEKLYTTQDGVHGGGFSGMATPSMIDVDSDLQADYVYAGDLIGNMWKFDVRSSSHADWQVAFCDGSVNNSVSDCVRTDNGLSLATPGSMIPKPLFSTGLKQPITSAPDIMRHETGQGHMVIFGSGKYLGWLDIVNTDSQSLYGIWDWAPDTFDEGYHGSRADNGDMVGLTNYPAIDGLGDPQRSLLKQGLIAEGTISEDMNDNGTLDPNEDINGNGIIDYFWYYRIPTAYVGDWLRAKNSDLGTGAYTEYTKLNGPDDMYVPLANLGWVVDLPGKLKEGVGNPPGGSPYAIGPLAHTADNYDLGERLVNDTIIRDGKAIMITFGLSGDKCGASAYSFLNERDANTGGMLNKPNFDIDGNGVVDWDDVVDDPSDSFLGKLITTDKMMEGRNSNPIIIGDPNNSDNEDKIFSGSNFGFGLSGTKIEQVKESAEKIGIHYWQQVE